jgi:thioredoxin 1
MDDSTTLFEFWAPWCSPCKAMKPIVERVLSNLKGIELVDINVDENPDMARKYNIRTIPTLILKRGEQVERLTGTASSEQLKEFLSK